MEPSNGASTCAFGSHRWVKYIGIFTKNAIVNSRIKLNLIIMILDKVKEGLFFKNKILINKGSEAVIV